MLRGVFAGGAKGICALIWPTPTFTILTRMVGLYCLADGVSGLVGALPGVPDRGTHLLQAVVSFAVGGFSNLAEHFSPNLYSRSSAAGCAVHRGQPDTWPLAGRTSCAEDNDRVLTSTIGGAASVVCLALMIWPGTGVVAISWIIALAALDVGKRSLIFLALRFAWFKKRVDNLAPLRSAE